MPVIQKFGSIKIAMYFLDHPPPHFHVRGPDGQALVEIETLEVFASSGRIDLREALEWAESNKRKLRTKWVELSGEGEHK